MISQRYIQRPDSKHTINGIGRKKRTCFSREIDEQFCVAVDQPTFGCNQQPVFFSVEQDDTQLVFKLS